MIGFVAACIRGGIVQSSQRTTLRGGEGQNPLPQPWLGARVFAGDNGESS